MATATNSRIAAIQGGEFSKDILRNTAPARLYEEAILFDNGRITSTGGLASLSGEKTGRSPGDKRIVKQASIDDDVWWGEVNIPMSDDSFAQVKQQAVEFLDECEHFYVLDAFAGWDPDCRLKVRVICSRAYHALFMHNMLIRPTAEELADFGEPDYVIYNAGSLAADTSIDGVDSETSVSLNFDTGEMVILGTEYAGEMKKGVFTIMNYLMPKRGILSMHCSCNMGAKHDVSLFFGLSGTGKTTLSADPSRPLIGDDEHCWNETGVFNIEGGCYAKCINLSVDKEPQIFNAIRYGSVLENTIQDPLTHEVDYDNVSITQNTRCSYPIEYIDNAKIPCITDPPKNIVFLTCDAFGVLPPVSKLNSAQAMYHFISGYTAKVAGTEVGVKDPEATFSACFGAAFLVWHPTKYAQLLAEQMAMHGTSAWLVNTGWSGGSFGTGARISLKYTRAIIDSIHDGSLAITDYTTDPIFGLTVPKSCAGVPGKILQPRGTWADTAAFDSTAQTLAQKFKDNFAVYEDQASEEVRQAGPLI
ncbi:MAG: phosphoenolpyruvate carboxykinase (ATP) [Mariniblastus sp.]|jgi:phosphoenolpyruvate carboxykinase (ATP)